MAKDKHTSRTKKCSAPIMVLKMSPSPRKRTKSPRLLTSRRRGKQRRRILEPQINLENNATKREHDTT
jgi:hypothetical protein